MIEFTVSAVQLLLLVIAIVGSLYLLGFKNRNQIAIYIFCVIVFACMSRYFADTYLKVSDELTITALNEKSAKSKGTEIDISNIQVDNTLLTSYDILEGKWYWISGRYAWRPEIDTRWDGTATNSVTLKVPVGWSRTINFYSDIWRGLVEVENPDGSKELIDTYSEGADVYSCTIGRSETRLLIINGIIQIMAYSCSFFLLAGLLFLMTRIRKVIVEGEGIEG